MQYKKEKLECKRDGLTIRGYLLRPDIEGRLPAVIISHGFGADTHTTAPYAKRFSDAGYVAVCFDFCGSGRGKSDGESTGMSVLTEKEDLSVVLDFVRSLAYVDSGRVILAGCSQGGLVSALLAAERKADVYKLILYFPAFCIPDDMRRGKLLGARFDPKDPPQEFRVMFIKLGGGYVTDAQTLDPYKEACAYSKPVLICHGTADRIVNVSYAQKAAREYPDCKYVEIKGGDHGFIFHGFKEAMSATFEFLVGE